MLPHFLSSLVHLLDPLLLKLLWLQELICNVQQIVLFSLINLGLDIDAQLHLEELDPLEVVLVIGKVPRQNLFFEKLVVIDAPQ